MLFLLAWAGYCTAQGTFLALDVSRITGFKRFRYYPGDKIYFKDASSNKRYKGTIVGLRDSVVIFADREVNVKDIKIVYRDNGNFVTHGLSRFSIGFGILFVSLDTFNNGTHGRKPLVNEEAVTESAGFVAAGLVIKQMMKHRYKMGKRRSVKIVDLSLN
jgi:hypothetical protein